MAVFKCKMCGGTMKIAANETVMVCEYCGTQQTLPRLDNERKANLYDRAGYFRRKNEFDRAIGIYEQILAMDETDAETYWSLVLCRYGIEYVEDPVSRKRVPTVNRTQTTSVFSDMDYLSAIRYADSCQRSIYEIEAKEIDRIQKGILDISKQEVPFDIFICYKENDFNGRRTVDSVLAMDLYKELTAEGYRVFFSRITLEDKLGTAYEPYIFSALTSAKVMVVIGTRPDYFNAVWVKNEWNRYLALMRDGAKKYLIPAYRDMDPYDLPEEFSHLQAQDMSKLGFMQDLIRNINKLLGEEKHAAVTAKSDAVTPLLRRAFLFLEDGDWESADAYCEKVLEYDPKHAVAYLGKLMASLKVRKQEQLAECAQPFTDNGYYQEVLHYADSTLKTTLEGYNAYIEERNERHRIEAIYEKALNALKMGSDPLVNDVAKIGSLKQAITEFERISSYADSTALLSQARKELEHILPKYKETQKKKRSIWLKVTSIVALCVLGIWIAITIIPPFLHYNQAVKKFENGEYDAAISQFASLGDYRDANIKIWEVEYAKANALFAEDAYEAAQEIFIKLGEYKDSKQKGLACQIVLLDRKYKEALVLMEEEKYDEAALMFSELNAHKDSVQKCEECEALKTNQEYEAAVALMEAKQYNEAIAAFEELSGYKDSIDRINNCRVAIKDGQYAQALALENAGEYYNAIKIYANLGDFNDAKERAFALWGEITTRKTVDTSGAHIIALKENGTVVSMGENGNGECLVSDWSDIVAIETGDFHSVGLKSDGTVVATGVNLNGQCDVSDWSDIVAISAGSEHTVGLKVDGTVIAVGSNDHGQCDVSGWADIIAIDAGFDRTVGLRADGTVVAIGENSNGECLVGGWTEIIAVASGGFCTVGLKSDGSVVAVGSNEENQCNVSYWTDIVAITSGGIMTVGVKADGGIVATEAIPYWAPAEAELWRWSNIVSVSMAGGMSTVGLKADGTVVSLECGYVKQGDEGYAYEICDVSGWADIKLPN